MPSKDARLADVQFPGKPRGWRTAISDTTKGASAVTYETSQLVCLLFCSCLQNSRDISTVIIIWLEESQEWSSGILQNLWHYDGRFGIIVMSHELYENTTQLSPHSLVLSLCGELSYRGNSSHTSATTLENHTSPVSCRPWNKEPARRQGPMTTNPGRKTLPSLGID